MNIYNILLFLSLSLSLSVVCLLCISKVISPAEHHILQFVFLKRFEMCTHEHHFPFYTLLYTYTLYIYIFVKCFHVTGTTFNIVSQRNEVKWIWWKQTNVNKNEIFRIYIISIWCCCCCCRRCCEIVKEKQTLWSQKSMSLLWKKRKLKFVCAVLFFVIWKKKLRKVDIFSCSSSFEVN